VGGNRVASIIEELRGFAPIGIMGLEELKTFKNLFFFVFLPNIPLFHELGKKL
jgi:hypothetical protein